MLERVPVELRDEFITKHPLAKVLDYMEREDEVFDNKTIYWKDGNLLGVYSAVTIKTSNYKFINNSYMKIGDIEKLIELSK